MRRRIAVLFAVACIACLLVGMRYDLFTRLAQRLSIGAKTNEYGQLIAYPGKREVPRPASTPRTLVAFTFGQSNSANHGSQKYRAETGSVLNYWNSRYFIAEDPRPYFYVPVTQDYSSVRVLHVRTSVSSVTLTRAIEDQVHSLAPDLPVFDVMTMHDALQGGNGFMLMRLAAQFAGALGGLGLLLAVVGVYGVISYAVNQRIHEIGIRMALGAQRENILGLVMAQGLKLVVIGLAAGLAIALAATRIVANLLVNTAAVDPIAYAVATVLLVSVAALACYIPARRAMRTDPLVALRYE